LLEHLVQVSPEFAETIFKELKLIKTEISSEQTITLSATGQKESFAISDIKKIILINGFDDIDYLQNIKKIVGLITTLLKQTIKSYLKLNSIVKPR
jgi:3-isopropylmalate/(R)-2-methylmalate dehydratase small subunit